MRERLVALAALLAALALPWIAEAAGSPASIGLATRMAIYALAAASLNLALGFGGMVSFEVAGGMERALEVCNATKIFTLGESLGGVESLIEHPAKMTHASVAGTDLEVPAALIRLSVGIEEADDLVADLRNALDSTR